MKEQKRGKRIAMSAEELNGVLSAERTCRVATIKGDGTPHVTPLWFAWDGSALWLYSIVKAQRWVDLMRNPAVAVMVDGGIAYNELWGIELVGRVEQVGPAPYVGGPDPVLDLPARLFAQKYQGRDQFTADKAHAWLRLRPEKIVSWDFRKIPKG